MPEPTPFGDFEPADAFDPGSADPEAVARILWGELRHRDPTRFAAFDGHPAAARAVIVAAVAALLARLHDEGAVI